MGQHPKLTVEGEVAPLTDERLTAAPKLPPPSSWSGAVIRGSMMGPTKGCARQLEPSRHRHRRKSPCRTGMNTRGLLLAPIPIAHRDRGGTSTHQCSVPLPLFRTSSRIESGKARVSPRSDNCTTPKPRGQAKLSQSHAAFVMARHGQRRRQELANAPPKARNQAALTSAQIPHSFIIQDIPSEYNSLFLFDRQVDSAAQPTEDWVAQSQVCLRPTIPNLDFTTTTPKNRDTYSCPTDSFSLAQPSIHPGPPEVLPTALLGRHPYPQFPLQVHTVPRSTTTVGSVTKRAPSAGLVLPTAASDAYDPLIPTGQKIAGGGEPYPSNPLGLGTKAVTPLCTYSHKS